MKPRTHMEWLKDTEQSWDWHARLAAAGIPDHLWFRLDDLDDRESDIPLAAHTLDMKGKPTLLDAVRYIAEDDDRIRWAMEDCVGFTVVGPPGTGKSQCAASYAMEVIDAGYWVRFLSMSDLCEREKWMIGKEDDGDIPEVRRAIIQLEVIDRCDLLVVDDLGQEHRTKSRFAEDYFAQLIRRRRSQKLNTVVTTNLYRPDITEVYGAATASFLDELGDMFIQDEAQEGSRATPHRRLR